MVKLTAASVERIKPTEKRQEIPDALMPGLYLTVQTSGNRSWQVRYRAAGVHRRMTLGRYPLVGLAEAREKAAVALRAAQDGGDPAADQKAAKAERVEMADRDTVRALLEQFDRRHLSRLKSRATIKRELDRHVGSRWGDRNVHSITKRDALDLLDAIVDTGREVTANRVRSYLGKFFNWLIERDVIDASPMTGIKAPVKEKSRDRVLSDDEIRWFWHACDDLGFPWGALGKTLLLTGQRLGEVVGITDAEISGDVWHMGADRTKNGRAHDVPLSASVQSVLAGVERIKSAQRFVFTTTGKTPLSGFNKGRNNIAKRMAEIAAEECGEPVDIPHWTFHDLRRTCATGMARLGIPVRVTEAVLNHVSGTGGGIVAVYQRHDYEDEKRQALDAWARFVPDLVNGSGDNVVRIKEARI